MSNQKKAIVLGGTNPHRELITNLKNRGYFIYLLDYAENPIAKGLEDEYVKESTFDKETVLKVAIKTNSDLVITTCSDQANVTACYVAEKLNLPKPYSYETALQVTNKVLMKEKMRKGNIPTANFNIIENIKDYEITNLQYPLVVKPADAYGSKGVRKADNKDELNIFIEEAAKITRNNKIIVEEFKEGIELSIDFFVENGNPHLLLIREKFKFIESNKYAVMQTPGTITPANLSTKIINKIKEIATNIVREFELKNTSLLIQAIVNEEEINVIEFAPRVGGGLSFRIIKLMNNFDIIDATINSFLSKKVNLKIEKSKYFYSANNIYSFPGTFCCLKGVEDLFKKNIIEEFYQYKKNGMIISENMSSSDRIGSFIIKGESREDLFKKAKTAFEILEAYDPNGNSMIRKDIYLKEYVH
jgi:phosphoribosylamine-glycine ligase